MTTDNEHSYANECPGCGNLDTRRICTHTILWPYYCHECEWGFGRHRDEENESPRPEDKPEGISGSKTVRLFPDSDPRIRQAASAIKECIDEQLRNRGISMATSVGILDGIKARLLEEWLSDD